MNPSLYSLFLAPPYIYISPWLGHTLRDSPPPIHSNAADGLGNWAGCLGWGLEGGLERLGHWPNRCAVAEEWWSSGAFGYWPQTVRPTAANGGLDYYFHLAMQGPGSDIAGVMKTAIQPVMEAVLRGDQTRARLAAKAVASMYGAQNSSRVAAGAAGYSAVEF